MRLNKKFIGYIVFGLVWVLAGGGAWYASAKPEAAVSMEQQDPNSIVVEKVIDGDTLDVAQHGTTKRVRLIGVNTPETLDPRKPVECFGKEASNFSKSIATGKVVQLELDPSQDSVDKYGRLLAYVYLPDGSMLNKKLVAEGYAYEYTYKVPYKYQADFKSAQKNAEASKLGLWDPSTCGGKR